MRERILRIFFSGAGMIEKVILFLICFAIYFFPDQNLDPLFLTLFTLAGILLAKKVFSQKIQFSLKINLLTLPLLSLPFSMFISTIFSSYKYPSLLILGETVLLYISFFLFSILEEKEKDFTLKFIMIISLFFSIFSISKYFLYHQQRASGNFANPNHSAFVLFAGLILIFSHFLEKEKKIIILPMLPIIFAIILSRSRSTLFSLFIFLPLLIFSRRRKNKTLSFLIVFLLLIFMILLLFPNPLSQYFLRTHDPFSFRRVQIWTAGLRMFMDNWIVGVGPYNFSYRVEPYRFPEEGRAARYAITFGDAHNDYIHLLAELGLLSIPFIFGIFLLSLRLIKEGINGQNWIKRGTSLAVLSLFFNSFFTNSIFHTPISFLLIILLSQFKSYGKESFSVKFEIRKPFKILLISAFFFLLISDGLIPLISNRLTINGIKISRTESLEKGLKILNIADKITPVNSSVKKEIGIVEKIIYLRTNDPFHLWRSASFFNESIRLNPYESDSHKELAELFTVVLRRRGLEESFKIAEFHWKKAISIASFNPFYYFNLSQLYILTYRNDEAEKTLKKCIELEPNYIMAHYYLYKIYEEKGDSEKIEEERKEVVRLIKMFGNKNFPSRYFNILFSVPQNVIDEMMEKEI